MRLDALHRLVYQCLYPALEYSSKKSAKGNKPRKERNIIFEGFRTPREAIEVSHAVKKLLLHHECKTIEKRKLVIDVKGVYCAMHPPHPAYIDGENQDAINLFLGIFNHKMENQLFYWPLPSDDASLNLVFRKILWMPSLRACFGALFDDDPKKWRMYAYFIVSAGSIFELITTLYQVTSFHFTIGNLAKVCKIIGFRFLSRLWQEDLKILRFLLSTVKCEPGYGFMLHLSQAALGESKKSDNALMNVKIYDQKLAIGTLSVDKNPHIQFDLVFDKEFKLSHTSKTTSVFFTGYKANLMGRNRKVKKRQFLEFFKKKDLFNNDLGGPYAFLEACVGLNGMMLGGRVHTAVHVFPNSPVEHEAGKKRAAESSVLKTPLSDKKAKVATPSAQKIVVPLNRLTKLSSKIV
ncbi:Histone deacetylase HDT1 [Zea mays]|uniref:Histone deacetylase HDT1 n=1 Tax=Zea mays TaxID=4577 RepID=A0A3L6DUG0_MAIZE|nr:Histone deacetylase HDT1 [Zea mays]